MADGCLVACRLSVLMLRPSSARDASTCLRCNLRLGLARIHQRRYQSSDESPLPTQDFPADPSAPSHELQQNPRPSRLRILRTHGNHGKIRGKKGGQRRVESSEPLSIASLGQSSEVIVLRDLHEPRSENKDPDTSAKPIHHAETAEPKQPALTGRDIENMSGRRALRPGPAEVNESVDALRPDEGVHVLTEDEFRQKFAALNKGYTIGQLKAYLVQKTAPARTTSSKANKFRRTLPESIEPAPTEISSTDNTLQNLKRTVWHAGTTSMTKRLPMVDFDMSIGRKMNNKDDVIESILRHAWGLGIEEEQAAVGEMEFLLSPMQFGLLLTKNSQTLKPLLESSKFYRNSQFQLHQPDRVIRIIGPRAEAEAIAHVLTEAYAPARTADINLETFHNALQRNSSALTLRDILSPAQLTNIMTLTRTYIHYDVDAKRLRIASFVDVAINDAHRLLIALLPSISRAKVTHLYDSHEANDCRLEAILSTKHLPSHAKHRQLGRWVTTSRKARQPGADPARLDAESNEHSGEGIKENSPNPPLQRRSPIIEEAVALLKSRLDPSEEYALETESPIWPEKPRVSSWKARVGLSLHDLQDQDSFPGANGLFSSSENPAAFPKQVFSFQVPSLLGLLSGGSRASPWARGLHRRTALTAHLIPSPLEQMGVLASASLPTVQLRFRVEGAGRPSPDSTRMSATLPDGKHIVLKDIRAIISSEAVQVNLPSHAADLRFEREVVMPLRHYTRDSRIRSFVEAIFESMATDAALRAPPALQLSIPRMVVESSSEWPQHAAGSVEAPGGSEEVNQDQTVVAKYLFAGFEYQEQRRYDLTVLGPDHIATVHSTEAGMTGGRRLELSLLYSGKLLENNEERSRIVDKLANASVNVINSLAKFQLTEPTARHLEKRRKADARKQQSDTTKPESLSREDGRAPYRPAAVRSRQDGDSAHDSKDFSTDDTGHAAGEEALQAQGTNDGDLSTMEKVAKQEQGGELDTDQDSGVEEVASDGVFTPETIAIAKPESQTRTFDADEHNATVDNEQALGTEVPTSTSSTIEEDVSEMMPTQTSSEPDTQEVKAEETRDPEEEPLSIRLRRMMGGGA